jgi:flavorubredoxin
MRNVLIVYLSLAGHTQTLAEYIAEGVRIAGCDAEVKRISEIRSEKDLEGYDGYIFGCPTYHRDMPEAMKTFLFMANKAGLEGKVGGAFGSYTHSGDAPKVIFDTLEHVFKMNVIDLGSLNVIEAVVDTPEYLKACHDYGKAIGSSVNKSAK